MLQALIIRLLIPGGSMAMVRDISVILCAGRMVFISGYAILITLERIQLVRK
jgi:hypothetical protein